MPSLARPRCVKAVREALLLLLDPLVEVGLVGGELDLLDGDRRLAGEPRAQESAVSNSSWSGTTRLASP